MCFFLAKFDSPMDLLTIDEYESRFQIGKLSNMKIHKHIVVKEGRSLSVQKQQYLNSVFVVPFVDGEGWGGYSCIHVLY